MTEVSRSVISNLIRQVLFITITAAMCKIAVAQNPTLINDSLVISQRVYAKERLIVDQDAKFKQDIKVLGVARLQTDLVVDGVAKFHDNVKMDGLGIESDFTSETQVLVVLPNGQLKRGSIGTIMAEASVPQEINFCFANGGIPQWWAGTNVLYTGCPDVNVGIATSSPVHKLHVSNGSIFGQKVLTGNAIAPTDALYNGFSNNNTMELINLGVKVGALAEEIRFRIRNDGSVKLVNSGNSPSLEVQNGGGSAIKVISPAGNNIFELFGDGTFVLRNQGTNPLFTMYSSNGSMVFRLEDSGVLRSRHIKVDMDNWADHVFCEEYELPTLSTVKTFIKRNGHLPGVPSESEIKADGLDVGTMQAIQMQKIEELTLYLIELEERINILEEENERLKNEK